MTNDSENKKEDEISLLDLFAVLLRYRKLIVGITAFSLVVAVAGYFIYPANRYEKTRGKPQIQGTMLVSTSPEVRRYVPLYLESFFTNAVLIMGALREAGMDSYEYSGNKAVSLTDEAERLKALYLIDHYFVQKGSSTKEKTKKKLQVNSLTTNPVKNVSTNVRDNYTIEVTFFDEDADLVKSFLLALFSQCNISIGNSIKPRAESLVKEYSAPESTINLLMDNYGFTDHSFFVGFLKGDISPLVIIGEPVISEVEVTLSGLKKSFRLKALLIVFAGFFLSVVLAFTFNAIHSVKNDPEAMKKINDALGKTTA